ncbi:hypothetical protein ZEAMMB73_Zm00001d050402 [Zea mays]|jgi:hypothetical protein|nr:hypothetical protein ZEAMMB73_Zm00001d050402 [Zea mays]
MAAARASVEELATAVQAESSSFVDPHRAGPPPDHACLGCRLRPASVVLLPYRHLSLWAAEREARRGRPRRSPSRLPRSPCTRSWSVEELAATGGDAGQAESSASAFVDPRCAGPPLDHTCLGCRLRPAFVVLLPCRHLSLYGAAMPCPACGRGAWRPSSAELSPPLIIDHPAVHLMSR